MLYTERNPVALSVVICACNESWIIENTLLTLLEAINRVTEKIQVIVVVNGSTDDTAQRARAFQGVFVYEVATRGASKARNIGAGYASGEFIFFLDADCEVQTDFFEILFHLLEEDSQRVIGPLIVNAEDPSWVEDLWMGTIPQKSGRVAHVGTGALILPRAAFSEAGGFDPNLPAAEDFEFCRRVQERCKLHCDSVREIAVRHHGNPKTVSDLFRQGLWYGAGAATLLRRAGDRSQIWGYFVLGGYLGLGGLASGLLYWSMPLTFLVLGLVGWKLFRISLDFLKSRELGLSLSSVERFPRLKLVFLFWVNSLGRIIGGVLSLISAQPFLGWRWRKGSFVTESSR